MPNGEGALGNSKNEAGHIRPSSDAPRIITTSLGIGSELTRARAARAERTTGAQQVISSTSPLSDVPAQSVWGAPPVATSSTRRNTPVDDGASTRPSRVRAAEQEYVLAPQSIPFLNRRTFLRVAFLGGSYLYGKSPGALPPFRFFSTAIDWVFGGGLVAMFKAPARIIISSSEPLVTHQEEYILSPEESAWLDNMHLVLDKGLIDAIGNRWLKDEQGNKIYNFDKEAYKAARLAQIKYGNFTKGDGADAEYFAHAMAAKMFETGFGVRREIGNADENHDYQRDMQDAWPQGDNPPIPTHYKEQFEQAVGYWMTLPRAQNPIWGFLESRISRRDTERRPLLDDGRPVTSLTDDELVKRQWTPSEIKRMAINVPVSSKADNGAWWGGAAGLSQLMPDKLVAMIEFYKGLQPPQVFDPWNPYHAMDGMGYEMRQYSNAEEAHTRYYGGSRGIMTDWRIRLAKAIHSSYQTRVAVVTNAPPVENGATISADEIPVHNGPEAYNADIAHNFQITLKRIAETPLQTTDQFDESKAIAFVTNVYPNSKVPDNVEILSRMLNGLPVVGKPDHRIGILYAIGMGHASMFTTDKEYVMEGGKRMHFVQAGGRNGGDICWVSQELGQLLVNAKMLTWYDEHNPQLDKGTFNWYRTIKGPDGSDWPDAVFDLPSDRVTHDVYPHARAEGLRFKVFKDPDGKYIYAIVRNEDIATVVKPKQVALSRRKFVGLG